MPTSNPETPTPDYVLALQAIYGAPSQAGFGSAVFYEWIAPSEPIEPIALKTYRFFVGDLWERWGETAWMSSWREVYRRSPTNAHQIVAEMRSVSEADVAASLSILLTVDPTEAAHQALSAAYDDATVTDLVMYALGDGGAMSGVLVAGRRQSGDTTFLILLLD